MGGIFNLFYMAKKEMQDELSIKPEEIDIIKNLKTVKKIIYQENIIPSDIDYKIGIEGLDYLKEIDDVDILYKLGVRSVNPVWNNHNKFGTGVRPFVKIHSKNGLTELGNRLILKLIKTGIAIDLSHADKSTFWDIINVCRECKSLRPQILASHSNCKSVYDVPRNLDDMQIKAIQEFNGMIGIVSVKQFCSNDKHKQGYIKHIKYVKQILGTVNNIVLATDDMSYYEIEPEYYQNLNIFKQSKVNMEITKLLKLNGFSEEEIEKIKTTNYINFWKNNNKKYD